MFLFRKSVAKVTKAENTGVADLIEERERLLANESRSLKEWWLSRHRERCVEVLQMESVDDDSHLGWQVHGFVEGPVFVGLLQGGDYGCPRYAAVGMLNLPSLAEVV